MKQKQKGYNRLTLEDRCHISALLKKGFSQIFIARELFKNKSTISRELKRNAIFGYRYDCRWAHKQYLQRRAHCHRPFKITGDLEGLVLHGLFERWSPGHIAGRLSLEGYPVSHETIYKFIDQRDPALRPTLKRFNKRGAGRYLQRNRLAQGPKVSISERPVSANNRSRFGHWERDSVSGANHKTVLLCVERKSRLTKLTKIGIRTAKHVSRLTQRLINDSPRKTLSVTNDNGPEFHDGINMKLPVYYCRPLRPQQRGTVENTAGLLREFISRQTDLSLLSDKDIKEIENKLNHRPRKVLGFKTPYEVMHGVKTNPYVALLS